ncbi:MAG: LPS export ABC transporter permease LptG [Pseudomonadota bacterium]
MRLASTLFRYMALRILFAATVILAGLLGLIFMIDLIEILRSLGARGGVDLPRAASMAALRAPKLGEQLLPFVFLFGSMWAMATLSRRSELVVMRAAGVSAWRILGPALGVAGATGVLVVTVVNPLGARAMEQAQVLRASAAGESGTRVSLTAGGLWLRQSDGARSAVISAARVEDGGALLEDVTVFLFDGQDVFRQRVDAATGEFREGDLRLFDCSLSFPDEPSRFQKTFVIATPFEADSIGETAQPPETLSVWELPKFVRLAKESGFPAARYEMHWHNLIATPLKLAAMALIAGAFCMQTRRSGGMFQLVLSGVGAGFALYVTAELAEALGESAANLAPLAAWTPTLAAALLAATLILHLEDG